MVLFIAAKFSQEEMPHTYDPGELQDIQPEEFIVVPRDDYEDVAFVAALEHKSTKQVRLRKKPYPKVLRRASEEEVEAWWTRKAHERKALLICKNLSIHNNLDIKITRCQYNYHDNKMIFYFTSEQRVDFRQLVKDLNQQLNVRIELWQIGMREETRMVDGFGVCGLKTCCSTWIDDFKPITLRMAKDQGINMPPPKLSGQCGRLLCCLSYEVDQYREMSREMKPKGATVTWEGRECVIADRNLLTKTYFLVDKEGGSFHLKHSQLMGEEVKVPEQMTTMAKELRAEVAEERERPTVESPKAPEKIKELSGGQPQDQEQKQDGRGGKKKKRRKPKFGGESDQKKDAQATNREDKPRFKKGGPRKEKSQKGEGGQPGQKGEGDKKSGRRKKGPNRRRGPKKPPAE